MEVVKTRRWNGGRPMQPVAMRGRAITPAEALAEVKAKWAMITAEEDSEGEDDEEEEDYYAFQASRFKDTWDFAFYGSFDETTKVPPMRFTDKKPEPRHSAFPRTTLQIFSLKVTGTSGGLQWPLHVFGKVAVRDSVDHKRNMIFDRTRDKCQFLTPEVPYLKLTGPTRAVVLLDPVTFDVDLKVKGTTESDDKHLSFLAVPFMSSTPLQSVPLKRNYTSKLSMLEFALGVVVYSVEASITVQVTGGSWPSGYRAQFVAHTSSIIGPEVILLDSGDDKVPVAGDGTITLSRSVASVEVIGKLKVSVKAWQDTNIVEHSTRRFRPKKAGRSVGTLDLSFCNMGVTVAWSLISSN
ncbi:unnamed protein product [Urochloa decumbens]|uniref:DUF6598 domain-containing protein n=1 Tax=Urochloa decumbens TaxID=240449 RepID=A0ABC9A7V4_9POAL